MKILPAIIICLIGGIVAPGQTVTPARPSHGLVILNLTWSRHSGPVDAPRTPRLDVPPKTQRDDPHANPADRLRGPSPIPSPRSGQNKYFYVYSLTIRNESGKNVSGIYWEYVATDPDNLTELNRRRLITIQKVGSGQIATLSTEYPSPPTNIVTPGGLGKDKRSPFTSSAEIKCVLYDDGSAWQAEGGEDQCAELRHAEKQESEQKGRHR